MELLRWIVINGLFAVLAYFALWEEAVYAQNFLMFAIWLITILTTFAAFSDELTAKIRESDNIVPQWLDGLYDLLFMSALATFGWFGHTALYVLHTITHQYTQYGENELDIEGKGDPIKIIINVPSVDAEAMTIKRQSLSELHQSLKSNHLNTNKDHSDTLLKWVGSLSYDDLPSQKTLMNSMEITISKTS